MTKAHEGSNLRIKSSLPIDYQNTKFLAHYDVTSSESLNNVKPIGYEKALYFNRANSYVHIDHQTSLNTSSAMTIEAWFYKESTDSDGPDFPIASKSTTTGSTGSGDWELFCGWGDDFYFMTKSTSVRFDITNHTNRWIHIAGTFDGTNLRIYVDGVLKNTTTLTSATTIGTNTQPLWIGRAVRQNGYFHGKISDVRLWNVAKSEREIRENMNKRLIGNETGLVGCWPLDEKGGVGVKDISVNNNHAATFYYDSILGHDGVDDYTEVPNSTSLNIAGSAITMESWCYFRAFNGDAFINKEMQYEMAVQGTNNTFQAAFDTNAEGSTGTNWIWIDSGYTISLNEWVHLATTYDGTNIQFYVNGDLVATKANNTTGSIGSGTATLCFGSRRPTQGYQNMLINDVRVWSVVRTQQEIKSRMFERLLGNEKGLAGYWKVNEGTGSSVGDSSTNSNTGNIVGALWSKSSIPRTKRENGRTVATLEPTKGKYGGSIAIEESTVNLETLHPEELTSYNWGWSTESIVNFQGRRCIKIDVDCPGGNANWTGAYQGLTVNGAAGDWFTRSCWMYVVPDGEFISGYPQVNSTHTGWTNGANVQYDMSKVGTWQFIESPAQLASGYTSATQYFYLFAKAAGDTRNAKFTVYLWQPQMEKKSFATSFVNGKRDAGRLEYDDVVYGPEGTISLWWDPKNPISENIRRDILQIRDFDGNSDNRIVVHKKAANILNFHLFSGGLSQCALDFDITGQKGPLFVAITWKNNEFRLYVNEKYVEDLSGVGMIDKKYRLKLTEWNYQYETNALIDELRIDKIARTPDEILTWYYSQAPFFPMGEHRVYL